MDQQRGLAAWTSSVDQQRGLAAWTSGVDQQRGLAAWTSSVDQQRGLALVTLIQRGKRLRAETRWLIGKRSYRHVNVLLSLRESDFHSLLGDALILNAIPSVMNTAYCEPVNVKAISLPDRSSLNYSILRLQHQFLK